MARTLDQIIAELNPTYQAQTDSLQKQQSLIPQQIASQESALNAQKDVAYNDIVNGARQRGVGFSGIPLGEQAKYNATNYAPALAGLRQQGQQQAMSLQDAILGINQRRDTQAQNIYQTEQDRAFQAQQAELNRKAAASDQFNPSLYQPQAQTAQPRIVQKGPGSFNFFDAGGQPITAYQYSLRTNQPIGDVLTNLYQNGDAGAGQLLATLAPYARDGEASLQSAIKQLRDRGQLNYILGGS